MMDQRREPGVFKRTQVPAHQDRSDPCRSAADTPVAKPGTASILIVDDQEDLRRMLATALSIEGHEIAEAANAAEGLARLKDRRFQLVLTDYAMPGGTGTSMLHEASQLGLLDRTAAVLITAHPDIPAPPGVDMIPKPFDLDNFLGQVRRLLTEVDQQNMPLASDAPGSQSVELVLYVTSTSAASRTARQAVERVVGGFDPAQVTLAVCDLADDPHAGAADHVVFTPTLVRRSPVPRMWLLGSIRDPRIVADLLRACGLEPRDTTDPKGA